MLDRSGSGLTGEWRESVAKPVINRVRAGDLPGAQALIDADARTQFDQIRAGITALQADIGRIRDAAVKRVTTASGVFTIRPPFVANRQPPRPMRTGSTPPFR